eukprot:scaffold48950_cov28-Tisochrysis_lutea.AAC.1
MVRRLKRVRAPAGRCRGLAIPVVLSARSGGRVSLSLSLRGGRACKRGGEDGDEWGGDGRTRRVRLGALYRRRGEEGQTEERERHPTLSLSLSLSLFSPLLSSSHVDDACSRPASPTTK